MKGLDENDVTKWIDRRTTITWRFRNTLYDVPESSHRPCVIHELYINNFIFYLRTYLVVYGHFVENFRLEYG